MLVCVASFRCQGHHPHLLFTFTTGITNMTTIVCHGDSLTQGADLLDIYRWPSLLANASGAHVINSGIGGDTTAGMLARFYPDVIAHKPDIVVIMGGTNDLWWDIEVKTIIAHIASMICQARFHGIAPMIGIPLPIDVETARQQSFSAPDGGYPHCVEQLLDLADRLKSITSRDDVGILDYYPLFVNDDFTVNTGLFLDDGVHPNSAGHRVMAELAIAQIKQTFLLG